MSPDELAKTPLQRGDQLTHEILGDCFYVGKVRNHPEMVVVESLETVNILGKPKKDRRKVHISTLQYGGRKAAGKQKTNLILCHCEHCGLKARVARRWLREGPPSCWNPRCSSWIQEHQRGAMLIAEYGEENDGVLKVDRSERMKQANAEMYGTYNEGGKEEAPTNEPAYVPGKEGEDDVIQ
jgi:hypothetical protein